jgi:glucose-1-phosphate thymidylyltransferase
VKGIVLAAGTGSRLWPLTWSISKHLLPVYDKPLIHYPISTLMFAGIREILIITNPEHQESFQKLLGDGSKFGVLFSYEIQEQPRGLAEAFIIGEKFVGHDKCALVLGDNIFYGMGLGNQLKQLHDISGAHIFSYKVNDPENYGVAEFDRSGRVISIEEKPSNPKSQFAIPGLYFYDNRVLELAKSVVPSLRGELEISTLNQIYLDSGMLTATVLERGTAWLDAGTFDSLNQASSFIRIIEERQGQKVSCLEEVAWRAGWISDLDLLTRAEEYKSSPFGSYLKGLLN